MTVLDTNVLSEFMRPVPHDAVTRWFASQTSEELLLTAVTMAEVLYGIEILPAGKKRDALRLRAQKLFDGVYAGRILPFDDGAARQFGLLTAARRKAGRPIEKLDGQIAAIARAHGAVLATRNTADFEGCGVKLVDPWQNRL